MLLWRLCGVDSDTSSLARSLRDLTKLVPLAKKLVRSTSYRKSTAWGSSMAAWEWLAPWRRKRNQVLTIP